MDKRSVMLSAGLVLLWSAAAQPAAAQKTPAYVTAAIADPGREAHKVADARRKPAALMTFAGVKPGDRVLDLIPGDGYFTKIFSKIVGPSGHVYAVWPQQYAKLATGNVATLRAMAKTPAYRNVTVLVQPTTVLGAPEPLDVVFTSQNYHDYPDEFMGRTDPSVLNNAAFKLLKPGGTYIVVDHVAETGSGLRDTDTLHRIDPETVKSQVRAAGFVFEGESSVLRNPADPHKIDVFDRSIRGRTDQFVYRFRKPQAKR